MAFWCAVLILMSIGIGTVLSQTDSLGFISIDCGLSPNSKIIDDLTGLTYVSDDQFIDTGVNYNVASEYTTNQVNTVLTVRSFPNGKKNCYTLRSLIPGSKYLIRGAFMYGNYDKLNKLPTFDLYLGVNYWETVSLADANFAKFVEIIAAAAADYMQVCLVNKGLGTPFISWLDLRPLNGIMYQANSSQSLVYHARFNLGDNQTLRYPYDPYDRYWVRDISQKWNNISTTTAIMPDNALETPSLVLQTAVTSLNPSSSIDISWKSDDITNKYCVIVHICEIQNISSTDLRDFNIYKNGEMSNTEHIVLQPLMSHWHSFTHGNNLNYNVSLRSTSNATLPPILNAIELYIIRPITEVPTYGGDVTALNAIKANYKVDKGWNGDPCVPKNLTWIGVRCTSDSSGISRITALNLSSSGFNGTMISAFGDLTMLTELDLSWNNLSGSTPTSLDELNALITLDISGNSLTLSTGLQKKQQSGALSVINSNSSGTCTNNCTKKNSWIFIMIFVVIILVVIVGSITAILRFRKKKNKIKENMPTLTQIFGNKRLKKSRSSIPKPSVQLPVQNTSRNNNQNTPSGGGLYIFNNRQFNHEELKMITNNFYKEIGHGAFGGVYVGRLENGSEVAVKKRSESSTQGKTEFLAEAKILTRVHHKYLVSFIGYCLDGDCMALVYEYMKEGTLEGKLRGKEAPKSTIVNIKPLTWKQRLRIAHQSAQGLDYLHNSCNPPLIHRDVKTSNILLNSNLEAKIGDFGLSKAYNKNFTHISTAVAGTPGYMDPDYYSSNQLTEKSDVYSFGVVMLEIVTGQPPIGVGPDKVQISQWVDERLSNIESLVDPNMLGQYDKNSVEKVIKLAQKCTEQSSFKRPTMDMVVAELKGCLELENISSEGTYMTITGQSTDQYNYSRIDNLASNASHKCGPEMAYIHKGMPPSASSRSITSNKNASSFF